MCCYHDENKRRLIHNSFKPSDWLIGYKFYDIERHWNHNKPVLVSPYRGAIVPIHDTNLIIAVGNLRKANKSCQLVHSGIHIYQRRENALNQVRLSRPGKRISLKVYGQVRDLLGIGFTDAVFSKVVIDEASRQYAIRKMKEYYGI